MSWMIERKTEGSESRGQRGGVKRGVKSAFALQFGMTLIIWSGPFWERRRVPVTTDVDYTKQGSLEEWVNKTSSHMLTHTHWVIIGALSSVLIDCNHHSFLANLPCSWRAGYCSLSKMARTYDNLSTLTMGLDLFLSNLAPGRSSGPAHVWNHIPDAEAEFEALRRATVSWKLVQCRVKTLTVATVRLLFNYFFFFLNRTFDA